METEQDMPEYVYSHKRDALGTNYYYSKTINNNWVLFYIKWFITQVSLLKNISSGIFQGQWHLNIFRLFGFDLLSWSIYRFTDLATARYQIEQ